MENFFLLMNSVLNLGKIPSSMSTVVDMSFAIMCGVGLFYLLIPFLKDYPELPPPGREKNIPKVVRKGWSKARKKTATVKGCRNNQKNARDTQNASRPMEKPIHHPLLDSFPRPFWYSKEKLNQLSLPQLFSYFKVLQDLIHQKCEQLLWGIYSVLSEAVVATAWVSKKSSAGGWKRVRFKDESNSNQALSVCKEPPQLFQDHHSPHQLVTPSLIGPIGIQELENLPNSIPNQRRAHRREQEHPTTEIGIRTSIPSVNEPWQHRLSRKDIAGCDVQKCQAAISQPSDNLTRDTLPTKAIRSASICPERYQRIYHHEDPQPEKGVNLGKQKGTHVRFCPSGDLIEVHEDHQASSDGYCKDQPELNQTAQPSILNSKHYKGSEMVGSVPTVVPLKKARFEKSLRVGAKNMPCTSSSTPGKGLEPRNPALKTDKLLSINTSKDLSFIDLHTKMKLESSIMQLPGKHRRRFPCASKAEYYSKTAMILENLHHQVPGGTRVETVSSARLQSPLFEHSPPEVRETQRTPLPAASHGPARSLPDQWLKNKSVQSHTSCLQAKCQQRTIQGTGRGTLQSNTSPGMANHEPWKQSQDVASGHPLLSATTVSPEDRVPPSIAPHAWGLSLGSSEIPKGQAINITLKGFESVASTKYKGQGNSLRNGSSLPAMELQEEVDRENLIYSTAVELQHLINTLLQNLENNEDEPSKPTIDSVTQVQEYCDSTYSSEGLYDPKHGRPAERMSSGHTSPEEHNHPFTFSGIGDKARSGIDAQSLCEQHLSKGQGKWRLGTTAVADWEASDQDKIRTKRECSPHRSPEMHNHSFGYREIRDKSQPSVNAQQTCDHHLNILNRITVDSLRTPKGKNHPCRHRVTGDKQQLELADQKAWDSDQHTRSGMTYCPHRNSKWHNLPFRYREIGEKAPSYVNAQRTCDQHPNSVKGRGFDHLPTPERNHHLHISKVVGDEQQSGLEHQRAHDAGQIKKKSGMASCPYSCPEGYNFFFRRGIAENKQQPGIVLRVCELHPKEGQSMSPKVNHSVRHREHGSQDQWDFSAYRASDLR